MELAIRKVIHAQRIDNTDALANPEALKFFMNLDELERVKGIEPSFSAWEADVLPLNDTRKSGGLALICSLASIKMKVTRF